MPEVGNRPDGVEKYIKKSLEKLQLDYLDLYLVHVPFSYIERGDEIHPRKEDGSMLIDPTTDHVAVWKVRSQKFGFRIITHFYFKGHGGASDCRKD